MSHQPTSAAHIISNDEEALASAQALAAVFAPDAGERDARRHLPQADIERFSDSGLWAITVPQAFGGAGVSFRTLAEVVRRISVADPSLGQLPQNHYGVIDLLLQTGTPEQQADYFAKVLQGQRFGNAFSESASAHAGRFETRIRFRRDHVVLDGEKAYATGALFAHIVPVSAVDEDGRIFVALVPRDAPGLSVLDTWDGFGQRITASGTARIEAVKVPLEAVLPAYQAYDRPTADGPVSQLIQAAIDAGIAAAAFQDSLRHARQARPWIDSGQTHGHEDLFSQAIIGDLSWQLHAAEALLEEAADAVDIAQASPGIDTVAQASAAVAKAKILTTEIALLASSKLFELAGTRSVSERHHLDRHWRNARTHTLHDPVRWKYHLVGNYRLNHVPPPRHTWN